MGVKSRNAKPPSPSTCFGLRRSRNQPYGQDDFDVLVLALLQGQELAGIYVIPMKELLVRGLIGGSTPRWKFTVEVPSLVQHRNSHSLRRDWQRQFFFDSSCP